MKRTTENERNRRAWLDDIDQAIARLAAEATPLNDRYADGDAVPIALVLRYVCALERRVADLESKTRNPELA